MSTDISLMLHEAKFMLHQKKYYPGKTGESESYKDARLLKKNARLFEKSERLFEKSERLFEKREPLLVVGSE